MKSDKEIMTTIAYGSSILRQLNEEESKQLKGKLLEIYDDVNNLCERLELDLILVGGSALGCVRHMGFIPWDDDLDVALRREDYNKLINALEAGELGDKYEYTFPSKGTDTKNLFLKIFFKGTKNIEIMDIYSPFPKGIYIDVFPIESAYPPGLRNQLKSLCSKIISYTSVSVLYREYRSNEYKRFMYQTQEGRNRYRLRNIIGLLGSFISHKQWAVFYDSFVRSSKNTGYVTIPTGRKGYAGETVETKVMFPPRVGLFEGRKVKIPGDSHSYLESLYGDYMTIPSVNKRERHYIVDFLI